MRAWPVILPMLLSACASTAPAPLAPALFDDQAFAASAHAADASALFTLSPAMTAHLRSTAFRDKLRRHGTARGLLFALYEKSDLNLDYDASVTRTAAETYAERSGNCLSLVIMTAAFARALDLQVRFQSVESGLNWRRADTLYLASSHVNVVLAPISRAARGYAPEDELVVDFLPSSEAAQLRASTLEEADIVALYMNNRAVEELLQGRIGAAYWWARGALQARPSVLPTYNTLAVIYQRGGRPLMAEQVYRAALQRAPRDLIVMQNLAPLLVQNGKPAEAATLAERIAALDTTAPFFYFNQAMAAYKMGDLILARTLFAREVARDPYNDEFHYWLGLAHWRLGEATPALQELTLARDTSTRAEARLRYADKLAQLRALSQQR